jgi:hypothetical protein
VALNLIKTEIITSIAEGGRIFDKFRKTCLSTDWCSLESDSHLDRNTNYLSDKPWCCPTRWKLMFTNSHHTNMAKQDYGPVEGEALGVAWSLNKASHFVVEDHKPLLKVQGDRKLEDIQNPQLCSLKEKTLSFLYKIIHILVKKDFTADSMSRYAKGNPNPDKMYLPDDDMSTCSSSLLLMEDSDNDDDSFTIMEEIIKAGAASSLSEIESVIWDIRQKTTLDPMTGLLHDTIVTS